MAVFRHIFWQPAPYLAWLLFSALALALARYLDPRALGLVAMPAALVSGALLLVSLVSGVRMIGLALLAALPTIAAFAMLWNQHGN